MVIVLSTLVSSLVPWLHADRHWLPVTGLVLVVCLSILTMYKAPTLPPRLVMPLLLLLGMVGGAFIGALYLSAYPA